jgi:hypothetical protein
VTVDTTYAPPTADIAARGRTALLAGVAGLVACGVGFAIDRDNFFRAWLIGYLLWLGVSLGSMGLMMIHHLSGGAWGLVVRRVFEASSKTLPLMAVLFVPIILGMQTLYPWTHADLVAADEILQHKAVYLNTPFFLARAVFYFAGWILIAWFLGKWSHAQDAGDATTTERMRKLSGGGLVFYAFTVTAASIDWVMSLTPHWYSTLFGFIFVGTQALSALAFTILIMVFLGRRAPMDKIFRPNHFHDLGKLTLAFVMLWAYFQFSQYMLIFSANLLEEIPYYLSRIDHGWQYVGIFLIVFQFIVPFGLLLSRDVKRASTRLALIAIWLLVVRFVDNVFLVSPEFDSAGLNLHMEAGAEAGEHVSTFFMHWLDLAASLAIGGLWLWIFFSQLGKHPLMPPRDPDLQNALESTGGH